MHPRQQQIFTELEALVASSEAFYRQEFILDGARFWIYNYRLASYTDFLAPSALECRGIMFEVDAADQPIRLASFPFPKFFNLNENPMTIGLDLNAVDTIELKADGSLMSTYTHNDQVRLKSKGSLFSEQAIDGTQWLHSHPKLTRALKSLNDLGWTVNLEWCAPHNRIVIGYEDPHLMVLNARHRITGKYMARDTLEDVCGKANVITRVDTNGLDVAAFVLSIPAMQDDVEGYVARIGTLWFKVKTEKYMSLHHAKDSINNPRRLFEAVVDEGVDDLRSMFAHDALAIKQIDEMQQRVVHMYNHLVATVTDYHTAHKSEDRKTYAIGAQPMELNGIKLMGLLMNMYLGKDPDFKGWLKAKYKELGFKDTATEQSASE